MRTRTRLWMISAALTVATASAQWPALKTPGIPRTKDGKVDLNAPAPKTAAGRVDLSGIWNPNPKFLRNIAVDLGKSDLPMRPWAQELYSVRSSGALSHLEPDANCLPQGVPKISTAPAPWKLVQFDDKVVILYEAFTGQKPYSGETLSQKMLARMQHEPLPINTFNPQVPVSLSLLVSQLLARRPEDRP